jgi:nitrous oxide reductase accessory protein NosL
MKDDRDVTHVQNMVISYEQGQKAGIVLKQKANNTKLSTNEHIHGPM